MYRSQTLDFCGFANACCEAARMKTVVLRMGPNVRVRLGSHLRARSYPADLFHLSTFLPFFLHPIPSHPISKPVISNCHRHRLVVKILQQGCTRVVTSVGERHSPPYLPNSHLNFLIASMTALTFHHSVRRCCPTNHEKSSPLVFSRISSSSLCSLLCQNQRP